MPTSNKVEKIFSRLESDYKMLVEKEYEVVGVFLYGSQNYKMDTDHSDIDTKAIVLPKFDDIVDSKDWVSKDIFLESGEKVDVKDVRLMFDCYKKQNINFLETLFTPYMYINPEYSGLFLGAVVKNREKIARYNPRKAVLSMYGNMKTKYKSMLHRAPHNEKEIDLYGYSLKDFHHIARINDFIQRYAEGQELYEATLVPKDVPTLISYKEKALDLEEAKSLAEKMIADTEKLVNEKVEEWKDLQPNVEVDTLLRDTQRMLIKHSLYKELVDGNPDAMRNKIFLI